MEATNRCIRGLNKMSQATGMYVPVAPLLLEALHWQGLSKATRAGGRPPSDAVPQLRAGKQLLETAGFQQALVEEVNIFDPPPTPSTDPLLPGEQFWRTWWLVNEFPDLSL